ncbi:MAG: SgcJ/EcaC family oxidoreductase [Acidobacteria bacterium]|nr:SgcJ/EcaC family oxidoreductase [Acidobacteriota bacterium]
MDAYADDATTIRELERQGREAAEKKNLDRYVSFYADDAVLFWPGVPMVTGRTAIRTFMQGFLAMPAFSLSFETAKVDVSRAGDFAYSYGTNKVTLVDPNGNKFRDSGKYVTVYRKQPDGTWKVVADIGNSDLPAPVPA